MLQPPGSRPDVNADKFVIKNRHLAAKFPTFSQCSIVANSTMPLPFSSFCAQPWVRLRRLRGMTLVELLLAVVVVAVLVGLAYPAYTEAVERSRRGKAIADISNIQLLIGRYETSRGELPDSLTDVDPKGFVDPWGQAYFYTNLVNAKGKGSARKDHKLNPINSDYDLFSAGKNRDYKSQITHKLSVDDIIRARDGAFIGVAADFAQ